MPAASDPWMEVAVAEKENADDVAGCCSCRSASTATSSCNGGRTVKRVARFGHIVSLDGDDDDVRDEDKDEDEDEALRNNRSGCHHAGEQDVHCDCHQQLKMARREVSDDRLDSNSTCCPEKEQQKGEDRDGDGDEDEDEDMLACSADCPMAARRALPRSRQSTWSEGCSSRCGSRFVVTLVRDPEGPSTDQQQLGLATCAITSGLAHPWVGRHPRRELAVGLRIESIKKRGLVVKWNEEHPDQQLKKGQVIWKVNGKGGDSEVMYQEIATSNELRLEILPSLTSPVATPASSSSSSSEELPRSRISFLEAIAHHSR